MEGKLVGMVVMPSDEKDDHEPWTDCRCEPKCYPLTGTDPDTGGVALGLMVGHHPFCELID